MKRPSLDEIFAGQNVTQNTSRPSLDDIFAEAVAPAVEPQKPGFIEGIPGFLKEKYVDPVKNFGRGAVDAAKSRALGIAQAGADALPDSVVSPEAKQLLKDEAQLLAAKRKQGVNGVGGFVGQVAGDPLTYLPLPGGGSIAALAGKGAAMGGLSGLTTPVTDDGSRLMNTTVGAALGGAAGAAIPAVTKSIAATPGAYRAGKRFLLGSSTAKEAEKNAVLNVAKTLRAENITPEMLAQRAADAKAAGLGATLPEFTQSSTLIAQQKQIANQSGNASNYLRNYFKNRNEVTVPNRLREVAKPLQAKLQKASESYNKIFTENNVPVDTSLLDESITNKLQASLPSGQKSTLVTGIKGLLDEAKAKGNTLSALHETKMEIDNLIDAAPTKSLKKTLKRESVDIVNQLKAAMDAASPEYAATRRVFEEGLPGNKIITALEKGRVGSIADVRNRLFGTLEKQKELQRAMTPQDYRGMRLLARSLDDIISGKMGGSDTAFNQKAQKELMEATGARGIEEVTQPTTAARRLANWYTEKVRQRDYEAIAKLFTDPDIAALGQALKKTPRQSSKTLDAVNTFAVRALANYGGKESQQ